MQRQANVSARHKYQTIINATKVAAIGVIALGSGAVALLNFSNTSALGIMDNVEINPVYQKYMDDVASGHGNKWTIIPAKYISSSYATDGYGGDVNSLTKYSLLDGYSTPVKNQGGDNNCWAYAISTAIESNLKKTQGIDVELSPKQIDYMFATTPYADYIEKNYEFSRGISEGGSFYAASTGIGSQYLPAEEASFYTKMQANDEYLTQFPSFQIYNDYSSMYGFGPYTKEMPVSDILSNAEYTVTDFSYYDITSSNLVNKIKQNIYNTGAVFVGTYAPGTENCWDAETETIIDRGYSVCNSSEEDTSNGHAMTIVGWDDDYVYTDPSDNSEKKGAFLVQNSWGKSDIYTKYNVTADDIADLYSELGVFEEEGKTDEQIAEWKLEKEEYIENYDPMEFVHLGYDFDATRENGTITFAAITKTQKNNWDNIYDQTTISNIDYGTSMKDSWKVNGTQEINAVGLQLLVPQEEAITFNIVVSDTSGRNSTTSIPFAAGETGQKFVELSSPVVATDIVSATISVDGYEFTEGTDTVVLARLYGTDDVTAVPDTSASEIPKSPKTGLTTDSQNYIIAAAIVLPILTGLGFFIRYFIKSRKSIKLY